MAADTLTLSLDIGTSSSRVMLWDAVGREVTGVRAQTHYEMRTTPDGGMEMDAEALLGCVGACLDQALAQAGDRVTAIRAVGMSTFWHSLLGLDADGHPLTPIYNWADQRSGAVAARLRHDMDADAVHARTGCVLHSSYYPAKLVWLRETQPDLFHSVTRWASPSEYFYGRWFGPESRRVSVSMASATGLFHQADCIWDAETLNAVDIPIEKLAPIVDTHVPSQGLLPEFAVRWPALKDVPFFQAVGDGACGNVGSGCLSPERFAINVGTSGAIRALWDATGHSRVINIVPPPGLWRYRVDSQRPLMGAAFSDGGIAYAWLLKTLQLPPAEELEKQFAALPPGAHGLLFLPFLAGERSLGWHADARAAFVGLNLDSNPVEIVRAVLEAVALRFALAAQKLQALFPQNNAIIASGGALAHSPAWAQIFADAIGQPVILAAESEASSRGAALLAMEGAGLLQAASESEARLGETYTPDTDRHRVYTDLLTQQETLYKKLIEHAS